MAQRRTRPRICTGSLGQTDWALLGSHRLPQAPRTALKDYLSPGFSAALPRTNFTLSTQPILVGVSVTFAASGCATLQVEFVGATANLFFNIEGNAVAGNHLDRFSILRSGWRDGLRCGLWSFVQRFPLRHFSLRSIFWEVVLKFWRSLHCGWRRGGGGFSAATCGGGFGCFSGHAILLTYT